MQRARTDHVRSDERGTFNVIRVLITGDRTTPVGDVPLAHRIQAIRVDYSPGGETPGSHSHPSGAFVYVIEGAFEMGLEGEVPRVLGAGAPGGGALKSAALPGGSL